MASQVLGLLQDVRFEAPRIVSIPAQARSSFVAACWAGVSSSRYPTAAAILSSTKRAADEQRVDDDQCARSSFNRMLTKL
jgi:hypothetical protein